MIANRHVTKIVAVLMAAAVLSCLMAMAFSEQVVEVMGGGRVLAAYESGLFNQDRILQIEILMEEEDWKDMLEHAMEESYYQCDVIIDGERLYQVGIRTKGNTSLSSIAADPETDRYSFKLEFDHYVEGQTCQGLDKLILNNNFADATNMKEAVVYDMYRFLDVDASLYHYAKISVNGSYWGVYLALEAVEESFLLRNYGVENGKLYKPEGMDMGRGGPEEAGMHFDGDTAFANGNPFEDRRSSEAANASVDGPFSENGKSFESGNPSADGTFSETGKPSGSGNPSADGTFSETGKPSGSGTPSADGTFSETGKPSGSGTPLADGTFSETGKPSGSGNPSADGMFSEAGRRSDNMKPPDMELPEGGREGMPPGFPGGFSMGSGGANLNYVDEDPDSYSTIWEGSVGKSSQKDHARVVEALKKASEGEELENYMDVDNLLRYMAVHSFVVNEDSLSGSMAHNYYLYECGGKLNILPWDYNLSFGGMSVGGGRGEEGDASAMINDPVDDPFSGTQFFDALLENETYLEQYHSYYRQLVEEYVFGGKFEQTYERIRSQIDELVKTDPNAMYSYEEYDEGARMLYDTVMLRAESVKGQLEGTIPSTQEEQKENPEALVDASAIRIDVMGTFSGGGKPDSRRRGLRE